MSLEASVLKLLVAIKRPRRVVELGTGDGFTASEVMGILPQGSTYTTINWPNPPSGDNPWRYLEQWQRDQRLIVISGDTRDPWVSSRVQDGIDLLYIDSTHEYECIKEEWKIYSKKLVHGATVVVDDLNHNDMMRFWEEVPFYKAVLDGRIGVFSYEPEQR